MTIRASLSTAIALLSVALVACPETHEVRYDGGLCAETCGGATPRCDLSTATCVACLAASDCGDDTPICDATTKVCKACTSSAECAAAGGEPVCSVSTGRCQACENTQCTTPEASRCTATGCGTCMQDGDCAHLAGTPVCDEARGTCVQCTGDTEAAKCGVNSCRRSDGVCTTTPRESVNRCGVCAADSECMTGQRCMAQSFGGTDLGYACLPLANANLCAFDHSSLRPFASPTTDDSIDGEDVTVCQPSNITTCEAIREVSNSCVGDDDCGASGLADGVCTTVSGSPNRCSIPCSLEPQCPAGLVCAGGPACH